jgi:hypothetical protein
MTKTREVTNELVTLRGHHFGEKHKRELSAKKRVNYACKPVNLTVQEKNEKNER